MAEALKVLGQVAPANINLTSLYSVPAATAATISSIVVCNRSASLTTFSISVAVANAADDNKQYLFFDQEIDAKSTFSITIGITLQATDVIKVKAGAANALSFNVFGIEVS